MRLLSQYCDFPVISAIYGISHYFHISLCFAATPKASLPPASTVLPDFGGEITWKQVNQLISIDPPGKMFMFIRGRPPVKAKVFDCRLKIQIKVIIKYTAFATLFFLLFFRTDKVTLQNTLFQWRSAFNAPESLEARGNEVVRKIANLQWLVRERPALKYPLRFSLRAHRIAMNFDLLRSDYKSRRTNHEQSLGSASSCAVSDTCRSLQSGPASHDLSGLRSDFHPRASTMLPRGRDLIFR